MEKTALLDCLDYIAKLRDHSLRRLPDMLDNKRMLFAFRSTLGPRGWINEGTSARYTAIALLGLLEAKRTGCKLPLDPEPLITQLYLEHRYLTNLGDLGLTLWVMAKSSGSGISEQRAKEVLAYTIKTLKEDRAQLLRTVDSMEFSWILLALLECEDKGVEERGFNSALENAYLDLMQNFNTRSSLFAFNRIDQKGLQSRFKKLAFFAEQIYGILALSTFCQIRGDKEALEAAEACADKLEDFQTAKGGWPWRYHAEKGTMAETFPLYSVHQDGMAPLALAKLSLVSSKSYISSFVKGINWLKGENEIGVRMFDEDLDIIWRSIIRKGPFRILSEMNKALSLIQAANIHISERIAPFYEIKPEVRSYHLGWILCASAAIDDLEKKLAVESCNLSAQDE